MKSVKYFYIFKIDHQICLTVKREQTQLQQMIIFDLKEISAEIVPYVRRDIITELLPRFLRDGMSRDLSKDVTYFGVQFLFPLPLPCPSSPQILVYHYFILTLCCPTMQTLTKLNIDRKLAPKRCDFFQIWRKTRFVAEHMKLWRW